MQHGIAIPSYVSLQPIPTCQAEEKAKLAQYAESRQLLVDSVALSTETFSSVSIMACPRHYW